GLLSDIAACPAWVWVAWGCASDICNVFVDGCAPRRLRFGSAPLLGALRLYSPARRRHNRLRDLPLSAPWTWSTQALQRSARNAFWRRCAQKLARYIRTKSCRRTSRRCTKPVTFETFASLLSLKAT